MESLSWPDGVLLSATSLTEGDGWQRSRLLAGAWREAVFGVRFALVGLCATAIHVTSVVVLITVVGISALPANVIAFCCSFFVSFIGNYLWTFGVPGRPFVALSRFLVIAVTGFLANNTMLVLLLGGGQSAAYAAVVSAAVVPCVSFLGSRLWGFKTTP